MGVRLLFLLRSSQTHVPFNADLMISRAHQVCCHMNSSPHEIAYSRRRLHGGHVPLHSVRLLDSHLPIASYAVSRRQQICGA